MPNQFSTDATLALGILARMKSTIPVLGFFQREQPPSKA
jgi:hypothetical protein